MNSALATLCLWWAIALLLGLTVGMNIPFILMCLWSLAVLFPLFPNRG